MKKRNKTILRYMNNKKLYFYIFFVLILFFITYLFLSFILFFYLKDDGIFDEKKEVNGEIYNLFLTPIRAFYEFFGLKEKIYINFKENKEFGEPCYVVNGKDNCKQCLKCSDSSGYGTGYGNGICLIDEDSNTCDDNNLCTKDDKCNNGICSGTLIDCNDYNDCTYDSCDPNSGCIYSNVPDESDCYDGLCCFGKCIEGIIYFKDNDGDGFGNPEDYIKACKRPRGYVLNNKDCNDNDKNRFSLWYNLYEDLDNDGYGAGEETNICAGIFFPFGYSYNNFDCNDYDENINPSLDEICDEFDNDCDGSIDEGCPCSYNEKEEINCPLDKGVCKGALQKCLNGIWSECNYGNDYEKIREITCNDNKDNDCDGLTDIYDIDCYSVCGNNIKEENEECDGNDLDGKSCSSFNLINGILKCTKECKFDYSSCVRKFTTVDSENTICYKKNCNNIRENDKALCGNYKTDCKDKDGKDEEIFCECDGEEICLSENGLIINESNGKTGKCVPRQFYIKFQEILTLYNIRECPICYMPFYEIIETPVSEDKSDSDKLNYSLFERIKEFIKRFFSVFEFRDEDNFINMPYGKSISEFDEESTELAQVNPLSNDQQSICRGVLLYFSADWCGPCKKMTPIVDELAQKGYKVVKFNFDVDKNFVNQWGVSAVPTFISIVQDVKTRLPLDIPQGSRKWYINKVVGATTYAILEQMLKSAINQANSDSRCVEKKETTKPVEPLNPSPNQSPIPLGKLVPVEPLNPSPNQSPIPLGKLVPVEPLNPSPNQSPIPLGKLVPVEPDTSKTNQYLEEQNNKGNYCSEDGSKVLKIVEICDAISKECKSIYKEEIDDCFNNYNPPCSCKKDNNGDARCLNDKGEKCSKKISLEQCSPMPPGSVDTRTNPASICSEKIESSKKYCDDNFKKETLRTLHRLDVIKKTDYNLCGKWKFSSSQDAEEVDCGKCDECNECLTLPHSFDTGGICVYKKSYLLEIQNSKIPNSDISSDSENKKDSVISVIPQQNSLTDNKKCIPVSRDSVKSFQISSFGQDPNKLLTEIEDVRYYYKNYLATFQDKENYEVNLGYKYSDERSTVHETTHAINSKLRNQFSRGNKKVSAFYLFGGKFVLINKPSNLNVKNVDEFIPDKMKISASRSSSYDVYIKPNLITYSFTRGGLEKVGFFNNWYDDPFFILDELNAYTNGAIYVSNLENSISLKSEVISLRLCDFVVYSLALAKAIKTYDCNYWNSESGSIFRSYLVFALKRAIDAEEAQLRRLGSKNPREDALNKLNSIIDDKLKDFAIETFGEKWCKQNLGFSNYLDVNEVTSSNEDNLEKGKKFMEETIKYNLQKFPEKNYRSCIAILHFYQNVNPVYSRLVKIANTYNVLLFNINIKNQENPLNQPLINYYYDNMLLNKISGYSSTVLVVDKFGNKISNPTNLNELEIFIRDYILKNVQECKDLKDSLPDCHLKNSKDLLFDGCCYEDKNTGEGICGECLEVSSKKNVDCFENAAQICKKYIDKVNECERTNVYKTPNFIVKDNSDNACLFAWHLEYWKCFFAVELIGREYPKFEKLCPVEVILRNNLGNKVSSGGSTSFLIDKKEGPIMFKMSLEGGYEGLIKDTIPHEVQHIITAIYFGKQIPIWFNEGVSSHVESTSRKSELYLMLHTFLRTNRGITVSRLFEMYDYPSDILPLYAQGYSIVDYLYQLGEIKEPCNGKKRLFDFMEEFLNTNDYNSALKKYYDMDLNQLSKEWLSWVRKGSPNLIIENKEKS
ncbi:MAG: thioredoxin domain-containing protein [Candidatus Pacearchaeota archaeon]